MSRSRRGASTRGRIRSRLVLGLGSLALSGALVIALEGALRLFGVGDPSPTRSRLRYQQYEPPILRPATLADGSEVLATADPRLPYQTVLRAKPAGALRVFVFGGSAAAGMGFSPNVAFARRLERMLEAASCERRVEVVNLGIVAFSSKQVRELVAEVALSYDADLLVVYCGNNEFLELHAAKYDALDDSTGERVAARLAETNLARAFQRLAARGRPPQAVAETSDEEVRRSEAALIEKVELSAREIQEVVDGYEASFAAMAEAARAHSVPILLMSVASNWRWRGRKDLPDGWIAELVGGERAAAPDACDAALAELDARIAEGGGKERHELLYKRALLREQRGLLDGARDDFRAAMNADPHLRRALDAANERLELVAREHGALFLDTVALLARSAEHGIVGFDEFYDYVHFTPRGALLVAAELFRSLCAAGFVPESHDFDPDAFVRDELAALESRSEDALAAGEWIGFCFDRGLLADRDLWKYERAVSELDARLARDPQDFRALVYRGNARAFRLDGAAGAASDYRAALALRPADEAVQANLDALLARRPSAP